MGFWSHNTVERTESGVSVESIHEDAPVFKRIYTARLDNRASIKVEIRTWFGRRSNSGELTQPNGRWISFDAERIADKIIDPILVPLVQKCVDEIFALDRAFVATDPDKYTDEHGCKWKRV